MVRAPLGVADDHDRATELGQHCSRHLTGVRPLGVLAHVLRAPLDRGAGEQLAGLGKVRKGNADGNVDGFERFHALDEALQQGLVVAQAAMHFPIAGDQRTTHRERLRKIAKS